MKQRIPLPNAHSKGLLWRISITIILLIGIIYQAKAQDSLYLVGTITGESYDKRITDVKGIGDVNGDSFDDFMVASYVSNTVTLYLGSSGLDLIKDVTFKPHSSMKQVVNFGGISGIGDVNADGYDDFIIHAAFRDYVLGKGIVFLYYGGIEVDTIPVNEFYEDWNQDGFGSFTTGIGDLNKDGYDDFVIGSYYNWDNGKGYAHLFWGGDTISWNRSLTFVSPNPLTGDFFGRSAANIGDVNNDGFDDLAIGAPNQAFPDSGRVYIYYGGTKMHDKFDTILSSNGLDVNFGSEIKAAGNLNDNNSNSFCVLSSQYIYVYIYQLNNPLAINGYSFNCNGDLNGDGFNDLIVGSEWKIKIYYGGSIFDTIPDLAIEDRDSVGFTGNISIAGDLNNDGYDEIISFAPYWPNPSTENPQGKVYIYSYNKFVSIKDYKENIPENFILYQNYPNPFNPKTIINYQLTMNNFVTIKVYDILGKEVAILVNKEQSAGKHKIEFDATKYNLSSGVYFYELSVGSFGKTKDNALHKKMVLLQ